MSKPWRSKSAAEHYNLFMIPQKLATQHARRACHCYDDAGSSCHEQWSSQECGARQRNSGAPAVPQHSGATEKTANDGACLCCAYNGTQCSASGAQCCCHARQRAANESKVVAAHKIQL